MEWGESMGRLVCCIISIFALQPLCENFNLSGIVKVQTASPEIVTFDEKPHKYIAIVLDRPTLEYAKDYVEDFSYIGVSQIFKLAGKVTIKIT